MSMSPRIALALAVLAPACTERLARPSPTAVLDHVFVDDDGQGVLMFREGRSGEWGPQILVRQTAEGAGTWQQRLPERHNINPEEPTSGFGGVMLLPIAFDPDVPRGSMLHVRLADGATREWAPAIERVVDTVVVGDAAQAFVVWRGLAPAPGYPAPVGIAAHDLATGERTWTSDDATHGEQMFVRLDEGHLLVGAPGADWQALRRSDGGRVALPIADAPGMCRAGDRWLAQRDDQLLAIDLRGATPTHQAAPATFVAPEAIHQWSLVDCAAHGDELVLKVNVEATGGGLIAGVDAGTLATRWTLELPVAFQPIEQPQVLGALPPRVGDTIVVEQGDPWSAVACAIDLVGRRVRWCAEDRSARFLAEGEDWLILGLVDYRDAVVPWLVRVSGGDGEVVAAVVMERGPTRLQREYERGGKLWLPFDERVAAGPDELDHDAPPSPTELGLVVLDARTLEPIAPHGFGRGQAASGVRDVMPEQDAVFVRAPGLPQELEPGPWWPRHPGDPLDEVVSGHPTWHDELAPRERAELEAAIVGAALAEAGLPRDTPIRVLASRRRFLLGFAAHTGADGPRWTLLKGRAAIGQDDTAARTFRRRPTAVDVHRFLRDVEPREVPPGRVGSIDEAAWLELTGGAREHQVWQLE
jgi:hypothetical protein